MSKLNKDSIWIQKLRTLPLIHRPRLSRAIYPFHCNLITTIFWSTINLRDKRDYPAGLALNPVSPIVNNLFPLRCQDQLAPTSIATRSYLSLRRHTGESGLSVMLTHELTTILCRSTAFSANCYHRCPDSIYAVRPYSEADD